MSDERNFEAKENFFLEVYSKESSALVLWIMLRKIIVMRIIRIASSNFLIFLVGFLALRFFEQSMDSSQIVLSFISCLIKSAMTSFAI